MKTDDMFIVITVWLKLANNFKAIIRGIILGILISVIVVFIEYLC